MTYNVSIGTLNPTVPYLSVYIQYLYCNLHRDATLQQDLKQHHLMLLEATDLAQNRFLWRMMSTYSAFKRHLKAHLFQQ